MGELKKVFRPELLNRIDEIIVFHKLEKNEILADRRPDDEAAARADGAARRRDRAHGRGARSCSSSRATTRRWAPGRCAARSSACIEDPLADFVLGRELAPGSTIIVDRREDPGRGRAAGRDPRHRGRAPVPGRGRCAPDAPTDDDDDLATTSSARGSVAPEPGVATTSSRVTSRSATRSRPTTGASSAASTSGGAGARWRRCCRSSSSSTSRGRASSPRTTTASSLGFLRLPLADGRRRGVHPLRRRRARAVAGNGSRPCALRALLRGGARERALASSAASPHP